MTVIFRLFNIKRTMKFAALLFIFTIIFSTAHAQDKVLQQISEHTFIYNGRTGRLHKFKDVVMLDSTNRFSDFNNFNINRKKQIKMNIISSAVAIPIVYYGYKIYSSGYDQANVIGVLYATIGIGIAGIGIGLSSSIYGHEKKEYKKSLLVKLSINPPITGYLRIETTQSGLGLVYRF
jgi:hypothetical protein